MLLSKQPKIVPIIYPTTFRKEKIKRNSETSSYNEDIACLLKYFPKYYKTLNLETHWGNRAVQSKVKQLKVVGHFSYEDRRTDDGKLIDDKEIMKRLFQNNKKTQKSLPDICDPEDYPNPPFQRLSLCLYFSRLKNLSLDNIYPLIYDKSAKSIHKRIYDFCGNFWDGNRFLENFKICNPHGCEFIMIFKKISRSKRFLSSLKTLELEVYETVDMEVMANKDFLRHVTHLKIYAAKANWEMIQILINSCPQVRFLSLSATSNYLDEVEDFGENFSLDLSCLQNLQVFETNVEHFQGFVNGINFPSSLREIALTVHDKDGAESLKSFFNYQEETHENQDARDWENFEKFKMLSNFFDQRKKLSNLKILRLNLKAFLETDPLMQYFILPLLRATPQLQTFCFELGGFDDLGEYDRFKAPFNLGMLFSELNSLQSLQKFQFKIKRHYDCVFDSSKEKSLCLLNLSSMQIDIAFFSHFNLKKLFKIFPGQFGNKILKIRNISLFDFGDFIKLLNLMYFKNFQADLGIDLTVESIDEIIYLNFKYSLSVPQNTRLKLDIYVENTKKELTFEQKEYFETVFGQMQFTVKKRTGHRYEEMMKGKLYYENCDFSIF